MNSGLPVSNVSPDVVVRSCESGLVHVVRIEAGKRKSRQGDRRIKSTIAAVAWKYTDMIQYEAANVSIPLEEDGWHHFKTELVLPNDLLRKPSDLVKKAESSPSHRSERQGTHPFVRQPRAQAPHLHIVLLGGWLLGGCFLREAPDGAIGSDRRAGKWGLLGQNPDRRRGRGLGWHG